MFFFLNNKMKSSSQKTNHIGAGVRSAIKRLFTRKSKKSQKSKKSVNSTAASNGSNKGETQKGGLSLKFWKRFTKSKKSSQKKHSTKKESSKKKSMKKEMSENKSKN
jgi:hypothetical protein